MTPYDTPGRQTAAQAIEALNRYSSYSRVMRAIPEKVEEALRGCLSAAMLAEVHAALFRVFQRGQRVGEVTGAENDMQKARRDAYAAEDAMFQRVQARIIERLQNEGDYN